MIKFKRVFYKNFMSAGNAGIEVDLDTSPTTLVQGKNGSGKCLDPSTEVDIEFENDEIRLMFEKFVSQNR